MSITKDKTPDTGIGTDQYKPQSVHRYEQIFGHDFLSAGGVDAVKALLSTVPIRSGMRVLDVGSGLGGAAFYLNAEYKAQVTGIDLLESMTEESTKRAKHRGIGGVRFIHGDVLNVDLDDADFDMAWSRDAFLHIENKAALFHRIYDCLRPKGQFLFTDYGRGCEQAQSEFEEYVAASQYHLLTSEKYRAELEQCGFENIVISNETDQFVGYLKDELARIQDSSSDTVDETDRNYLVERWEMKLRCCASGDMRWYCVKAQRS